MLPSTIQSPPSTSTGNTRVVESVKTVATTPWATIATNADPDITGKGGGGDGEVRVEAERVREGVERSLSELLDNSFGNFMGRDRGKAMGNTMGNT